FLYNPRMASMPLIVVEAVRKLRYNLLRLFTGESVKYFV
ncbi:hypothetical protein O991_01759, partial [Enterococcus faecium 10/96A]